MIFMVGIALFALAIPISVALHARPYAGWVCDGHAGAPLLRRFRTEAVVPMRLFH